MVEAPVAVSYEEAGLAIDHDRGRDVTRAVEGVANEYRADVGTDDEPLGLGGGSRGDEGCAGQSCRGQHFDGVVLDDRRYVGEFHDVPPARPWIALTSPCIQVNARWGIVLRATFWGESRLQAAGGIPPSPSPM